MSDTQIWVTIIGGLWIALHAINTWTRLRAAQALTKVTVDEDPYGPPPGYPADYGNDVSGDPKPVRPDPGERTNY